MGCHVMNDKAENYKDLKIQDIIDEILIEISYLAHKRVDSYDLDCICDSVLIRKKYESCYSILHMINESCNDCECFSQLITCENSIDNVITNYHNRIHKDDETLRMLIDFYRNAYSSHTLNGISSNLEIAQAKSEEDVIEYPWDG